MDEMELSDCEQGEKKLAKPCPIFLIEFDILNL